MRILFEQHSRIQYLYRAGNTDHTLVFLHGIGSNAVSFECILPLLPNAYNVVAWNAPGYGDSAPVDTLCPTAKDYAERLRAFLTALHIDQAVILGHSLGTLIGAKFTQMYPRMVQQLFLVACACGYQWHKGMPLPASVQSRIDDVQSMPPEKFAKLRARNLVWDATHNPDVIHSVETQMAKINPDGYVQASKMLASGDLVTMMGSIRVPTQFIIGDKDTVTPITQTQQALQALPEYKDTITVIKDAGHAIYQQQPQQFVNAVLQKILIKQENTI